MTRSTRRSQSVVPFGVGSIVEFEDEALMAAGLDVWPPSDTISDQRLARRLGVKDFRLPPAGSSGRTVPYVRFPQWHFCPRCRALHRVDLYGQERPRCASAGNGKQPWRSPCAQLPERRRPRILPLRFLAVCEAGHVEDFPWNAWVHTDATTGLDRDAGCKPETLFFYATVRGGLSGLLVECASCSMRRSLMGVTSQGGLKGLHCRGERPWLGKDAHETCSVSNKMMMALQRGASNLYFPEVNSSILIPPHSRRVTRLLDDPLVRKSLTAADDVSPASDDAFAAIASVKRVDAAQLKAAFAERRELDDESAVDVDETEFRRTEYVALQQPRVDPDDELECVPQPVESYEAMLHSFVTGVSLVERLTETRALTSFSRIKPALSAHLSRSKMNWLPAFQVRGEGIFLRFDLAKLHRLPSDDAARMRGLVGRGKTAMKRTSLELSPELIFLHTFAHLLIKRLSFEAGYGTSSIRERLYSSNGADSMAGILLYTAAGDADGTLGGLVSLGRMGRLERIVAAAIDDGRWCAADPICVESPGQGPESLNLAACHACALLPETSCELQNRYLDRKIVQQFFEYL